MKKFSVVLFAGMVVLILFSKSASAVSAASLKFDQSSYSAAVGSTIQVQVIVSPGTDTISSTDAHVLYDPTVLQATSVAAGTYFPSVTNAIASGNVSIYATVNDVASSKTGDGTIATITFTVLKDGSTTLQYFCDTTDGNSSAVIKYDQNNINAPNVIVCSQNASATVTGGSGGSGGGTLATPTPITSLPSTGTVQNLSVFAILGAALIVVGGVVKFFL